MARVRLATVELEYRIDGPDHGSVIILSTGFGDQLTFWPESFVTRLLTAGFRVVRFDTRDAGLSSSAQNYDLDDMAEDLAGLIDHFAVKQAFVVGYSMGGQIAMRAALAHPEKIAGLALVFTTSGATALSPPLPEAAAASFAMCQIQEREAAIETNVTLIRLTAEIGAPFDEEVAHKTAVARFDRAYRPEGAMRHMQALMTSSPICDRLSDITAPTLVLQAEHDCFFGKDHGDDLATRLRVMPHLVAQSGHDLAGRTGYKVAKVCLTHFLSAGQG